MRRIVITLVAFLTLMGTTTASNTLSQSYPPLAIAVRERGERHPMIRKAINALQGAKDDLEDASHDFCGHRAEALEATNSAIRQLRLALESDRASLEPLRESSESGYFESVSYIRDGYPGELRERHPKIRAAINALERARNDLQHAAHDFRGHRDEALEATNRALNQLKVAIACDRR
jgi:outer membrane protein TolC